ncbi:unnamed protein product, partial [Eruca vesicaria subsp. sativa]|nr:unnamed protein product [Eruca vesicaria subsp. sativa]
MKANNKNNHCVYICAEIQRRSKEKRKRKKKNGGCSVVKLEAIDSNFSSFEAKSIPF